MHVTEICRDRCRELQRFLGRKADWLPEVTHPRGRVMTRRRLRGYVRVTGQQPAPPAPPSPQPAFYAPRAGVPSLRSTRTRQRIAKRASDGAPEGPARGRRAVRAHRAPLRAARARVALLACAEDRARGAHVLGGHWPLQSASVLGRRYAAH